MASKGRTVDCVGVGIGPANLSLAALSHATPHLELQFFEKAKGFSWHPGLLFPESSIQTSYLKDLVTPVAPTNPYSFLSFLVEHRRFYSFVTANVPRVSRSEFNQYLTWVSEGLSNLQFGSPVIRIEYQNDYFEVRTPSACTRARNVVLGTGRPPYIPHCARPFLGPSVHHAVEFGHYAPKIAGRRVAVIGGGQSGAELVHHFLLDRDALPSELYWISRRGNFQPLDESPFANELFTPEYTHQFYRLGEDARQELLREQLLASDGISGELLDDLYRRLYSLQFVDEVDRYPVHLLPGHELVGIQRCDFGWAMDVRARDERCFRRRVDLIVLATGHRYRVPQCLEPVRHRIEWNDGEPSVDENFAVIWDGPPERRIFVQNASRNRHGVADPNLSLLAWRSAVILNQLAGRIVYDCQPGLGTVEWGAFSRSSSSAQRSKRALA